MRNYELRMLSGSKYWNICWRENGRSKRRSTGCVDKQDAKRVLEREIAARARPHEGQDRIDQLLAYYLNYLNERYRETGQHVENIQKMRSALKAVDERFGHLAVNDISAEVIREFGRERRKGGAKDGTIRRNLALFKAALNRCKKEGIYKGEVPLFDLPPAGPPRKDILSEEQLVQFISADAYPHIDLFCCLMINTLKRPSAILDLQWSWGVDFDSGILDFQPPDQRETKKRRTSTPMNGAVRTALLEAYRSRTACDHVIEFNSRAIRSIKKGFKAKARNAGMPQLMPYTLRHTGASLLSMRGVPLADISEMMGSDEATVRKHYRKFQPEYLRAASESLESLYTAGSTVNNELKKPGHNTARSRATHQVGETKND